MRRRRTNLPADLFYKSISNLLNHLMEENKILEESVPSPRRSRRRRRWLWGVILTPPALFFTLMVLLYVPPIQQFIRQKATSMASDATGMEIRMERIDLRFPLDLLVRGVQVVQPADTLHPADTLLQVGSLRVRVQAWPLLRGQVEVDEVSLEEVMLYSSHLLEGMEVRGRLGNFHLVSHGIDLSRREVVLNSISLADTQVDVCMADTTEAPADTAATALPDWKVTLHELSLADVGFSMQLPLDSTRMAARIGSASVAEAQADLKQGYYGCQSFALKGSSVGYDVGTLPPAEGLDPSHIALRDMEIVLDSVWWRGRDLNGVLRRMSMNERSGLCIRSLTARVYADSTRITLPELKLLTPHSELTLSAQTYWRLIDIPTTGHLSCRLDGRIGKTDVMLLAGGMPKSFQEAYPPHALVFHAGTEGNLKQMQISRIKADLPGAFSLNGGGEFYNLSDSLRRNGAMDLSMQTYDLNFLTALAGMAPGSSLVVPDSMQLAARMSVDGPLYQAQLRLQEQGGRLTLEGTLDASTEQYRADLNIDSLQLHHFLPQDSLYLLTAHAKLGGKGFQIENPRTTARLEMVLDRLHYGRWHLNGMGLKGGIERSVGSVSVYSHNPLLQMQAGADMRLDRSYLDGRLEVDVRQLDLHELGIAPRPLAHPFAFTMQGEARRDSVKLRLDAGDMNLRLRARSTLKQLMAQGEKFMIVLNRQIEERRLDHAELRRTLPSAGMHLYAGRENPVSYFLATKEVSYDDFKFSFGFTPTRGINGRTAVHGLRIDSLQLDTLFFAIRQDTARMTLQGGVINGPKNPQRVFRSTLTGEVRSEDAELSLDFTDGKGKKGVLFGINARPLTEGHGKGNGLLLHLTPQEPVIAYRRFRFVDQANWIYLHKNMRVYANVDMDSDEGLCFRMQSNREDTVSLQNINLELSRFQLSQLSDVIPYMPRLSGLFSVEAQYIQTPTSLQVSTEAQVDEFTYERRRVGDLALGATWLPGDENRHYIDSYLTYDGQEVMTAGGRLSPSSAGNDSLQVEAVLEHFPMKMLNAFVPDGMVAFAGDVDGSVEVSGSTERPLVNGELMLDSVSLYARQVGARYLFDKRPVTIQDNRLNFNKFAIFTTSNNPFTIDGYLDFRQLDKPTASLNLLAENYTLLDAPRTRESLIYGKVFVDVKATVRGPLEAPVMRGRMNLLGNTNVTYVMTDSPLTVEDRLDGLVTFTAFNDTLKTVAEEAPSLSLGGMDMVMMVHIDDAVRLRADLSSDRSKYVELQGGGDLNMQYTPQGDMSLTGRYTLTDGTMKYSLPIIPLKEFKLAEGSYVDWRGDIMNPTLSLTATERVRASVADGDNGGTRMVNFDVSIAIKNRLEAPELVFDIAAPEDAAVANELQSMGAEERSKQAIAMLATGIYMNSGVKGGGLNMNTALNSVLQSQINALAGSALQSSNASFSVGLENRTSSETGDSQTDYSFRYSQRFFGDRVQINIGGKYSAGGSNTGNNNESFIDNISLEYRLDRSGGCQIRVFYNKNYESVLDGEITETGAGLVLRKKMDRLGELFILRRRKQE